MRNASLVSLEKSSQLPGEHNGTGGVKR